MEEVQQSCQQTKTVHGGQRFVDTGEERGGEVEQEEKGLVQQICQVD